MNIFMAIGTPDAYLTEFPFPCFLMAYETRCGQVRSLERKCPCIMLFNGKSGLGETFGGVTIGATHNDSLPEEFSFMVIFMAISTLFVFNRRCQALFVAGGAFQAGMLVLQPKAGP
jgi:hypothetical protein